MRTKCHVCDKEIIVKHVTKSLSGRHFCSRSHSTQFYHDLRKLKCPNCGSDDVINWEFKKCYCHNCLHEFVFIG